MLSTFADGALFGEVVGTGPASVVCLHGWGRTHRDAIRVLALDGAAPIDGIALDLPGFGASPPPAAPFSSVDFARALLPVFEGLPGPVVVMGHSHGGRVAVALADLRPDLVAGLVLVGAPVVRRSTSSRPSVRYRLLRRLHRLRLLSDERFEQIRRRAGSADYNAATGVMRDTFVRVVNESLDAELGRLSVPVALVWGEHDDDVPLAVAQRARDLIAASSAPSVELTVVPGVGHLTVTEAPAEVRRILEAMILEVAR